MVATDPRPRWQPITGEEVVIFALAQTTLFRQRLWRLSEMNWPRFMWLGVVRPTLLLRSPLNFRGRYQHVIQEAEMERPSR